MSITLKGMTWSHPRGYDPMMAASRDWLTETGVSIAWDKRSLQDFESFPVEELARSYDLIVIDHPHVGQVWRKARSAHPSRVTTGRAANGPFRSTRRRRCSPSGRIGSPPRRHAGKRF
jgi:hypothetical protein